MSATRKSLPFTSMHLNVMNTLEQIVGYRKRMTRIASLIVSAVADANVKRAHGSLRTAYRVLRESRLSTMRATERTMRSRQNTMRMMSGCGKEGVKKVEMKKEKIKLEVRDSVSGWMVITKISRFTELS